MKYYSLKKILKEKAQYNVIFGERSSGKTYACLKYALEKFCKNGEQAAIIRRWDFDFKGKNGQTLFDSLVNNGVVNELTRGEWTGVYFYSHKWFFCRYDENGKREVDGIPFAYAFAISMMEHDKSTSYPKVTTIIFDEFMSRSQYLPDEFVLFSNVLSTIIRERNNVTIFMLGNTVNKYCPYFNEMGLTHIKDMKVGDIDLYRYGEKGTLKVAVEYTEPNTTGKPSDVYFAFDNPKLQMITGGEWEIDIYPHCPCKYRPADVVFEFFIEFDRELLHAEVVSQDIGTFIFIHRKTTELKHKDRDLIYTTDCHPQANYRTNILKPIHKAEKIIYNLFKSDKVFYSSNDVGEVMRNYLLWCKKGM